MSLAGFILYLFVLLYGSHQKVATVAAAKTTMTARQNPYLKEIVMGRCYEHPPVSQNINNKHDDNLNDASSLCPFVVDSLLGVLDGYLDADITNSSFYMYFGMTSYDSPKDAAVFVWPPPVTPTSLSLLGGGIIDHLALPETTPGGTLMQGLIFCGTDRRMACPVEYWTEDHGGLLAFWQGVYANFAASVQGLVRMVVLENIAEIPRLWKEHVLSSLSFVENVTRVDIIAINCDGPGIFHLITELQTNHGISAVCNKLGESDNSDNNNGGGASEYCALANLLSLDSDSFDAYSGSGNNHKNYNSNNNNDIISVVTTAPSSPGVIDCRQCSSSGDENVYAYLFWALMLLIVAAGYALWSVKHYLPEYRRIPDVTDEHELAYGGQPRVLPKQ